MSLAKRIIKSLGKDTTAQLLNEIQANERDVICQTPVPIVNIMLSGDVDGGITPGIIQLVGDSRMFKTNFGLLLVKAYLDHDPEAICVFLDTEKGARKYFKSFDIDESRVVYLFCENLEELKFTTSQILDETKKGDKVIFLVDSISQVPSKKEVENAVNENSAADLTRAREMNSYFRIITPKVVNRDLVFIAINSSYDSIVNPYAEPTVKGGTQSVRSSDIILTVSRSQEKDSEKKFKGWSFNYNAYKSRYLIEKSKFSLIVTFDGGIYRWSGLMDLAREGGFVTTESRPMKYRRTFNCGFEEDRLFTFEETNSEEFWFPILQSEPFKTYIRGLYKLAEGKMLQNDVIEYDEETGEVLE